ncbi:MAG: hypothetical protein AAFV53_17055 [Myxococcota bacterium]
MSTETLLEQILHAAQDQLQAARTLNAADLSAATERRAALLHTLQQVEDAPDPSALPVIIGQLSRVDERMNRIFLAAQSAFARVSGDNATYGRDGRMRGGV